jgi:hypothetical protein
VNKASAGKRTLGRVLTHAMIRHPALVPIVARFFV